MMIETRNLDDKQEITAKKWSPYLVRDRARPGDVLLLRGSGLSSTGIAKATGGTYSHAMLLLPVGWGDLWIAAEADHLGVGSTPMMPVTFEDPLSEKFISALSIPNRPAAWQLYRHPDIGNIAEEALLVAANRLRSREFYLSYSKLHRLIAPVPADERLKVIVETLVAFTETAIKKDRSYGAFCSELVAIFYEDLGIALFDQPRAAELVSPNDLSDGRSHLIPVSDAFVVLDEVAHWTITRQFPEIPFERKQVLPYLVSQTRQAFEITEKVGEIIDIADRFVEYQLDQSKIQALELLEQMKASETQYANFGDNLRAAAIRQIRATVDMAMRLRQIAYHEYLSVRTQGNAEHSYDADGEIDGNSEDAMEQSYVARMSVWATVFNQIMIIAETLTSEASHKHLRLSIGFGLSVNAIALESKKSVTNYLRARRHRARLLRTWKQARKGHEIARNRQRDSLSLLQTTAESDLALQLVIDASIREMDSTQSVSLTDLEMRA